MTDSDAGRKLSAAIASAEAFQEASRKKGLMLEIAITALTNISQLPLGSHDAKKIAIEALAERTSAVAKIDSGTQPPSEEGWYCDDCRQFIGVISGGPACFDCKGKNIRYIDSTIPSDQENGH